MSLLDSLGGLLGAQQDAQPHTLVQSVVEIVNRYPGGLHGILDALRGQGAGTAVDSWVGHGENQDISPDTVHAALGTGFLGEIASRFGVDPARAGALVASVLPLLVDHASADGHLPANGQLDAGSLLGKLGQLSASGALGGLLRGFGQR